MEWKLWEGEPPEWTTPEWYAGRESASHLEQDLHRRRLHMAALFVDKARARGHGPEVVDLGAGDGGLLSLLADMDGARWGYDLQMSNVQVAMDRRGVKVHLLDVVNEADKITWADIAVCTEMLEHLVDPHAFVRQVAEHSRVLVASSPWTESDQFHYEFHTWAWDRDGYRALMEQAGFEVKRQWTTEIFQVVLAIKP